MKILQIHNSYKYVGGEDVVVELEKNLLLNKNHSVKQLIRSNKNEIKSFSDKFTVAPNLSYSNFSRELLNKEIKKIKPDIVHIHNFFPLWTTSVLDACIDNNIPTVMTMHNYRTICANGLLFRENKICEKCLNKSAYYSVLHGCYQSSRLKSIPVAKMINYNRKRNILNNKINRFIALTDFAKKKFIQANFNKNKIFVKPNFIPTKISTTPTNEVRQNHCLYVGRLSEEKGITMLLKAWENINYPLKILGDGPLYSKLNKNQPNITFFGHQNKKKIFKEMRLAKFLVFPTVCYEGGFPLTILESFASGLPVLASNIGSISGNIIDKYNGILFKPGNIRDIRKKINWILSNNNKCRQISKNALIEFKKKYSSEINYNLLLEVYKEAIKDNLSKNHNKFKTHKKNTG